MRQPEPMHAWEVVGKTFGTLICTCIKYNPPRQNVTTEFSDEENQLTLDWRWRLIAKSQLARMYPLVASYVLCSVACTVSRI